MNNKTVGFIIFLMGAAAGSAATWQYLKKKYEQIAQDEIDSVKRVFSNRESENLQPETQEKANRAKEKPNIVEYAARLQEQGYVNYSAEKEEAKTPMAIDKPYVISPEEFGDFDEYEKISLTYYSDQVLTDDNDELVEDLDDVVGFESLTSFGEYEDDSVFVRNDRLKCDYEILLDHRNYLDVIKRKPHEVE